MNNKLYRYTIFSNNGIGIISQIAVIFTNRKVNIENMSISNTSYNKGVFKFSITVSTENNKFPYDCYKQILKIIEVIDVVFHKEDEVIKRELGLFKFKTSYLKSNKTTEFLLRYNLVKLSENNEYSVFEKTEIPVKLKEIYHECKEGLGLIEFSSSGAVVLNK